MSLKDMTPEQIAQQRAAREELAPERVNAQPAKNVSPNDPVLINIVVTRGDRDRLKKLARDVSDARGVEHPYSELVRKWIARGMDEQENELKKGGKQ